MKNGRTYIPKVMQPEILQKIHYGHRGMEKCRLWAKSCIFSNSINQDIDKIVHGCVICQEQQKAQCAESLKPHEISARPWQIAATDLFQFGRSHYMLVVDYYSKYPLVRKLKDFSSQEKNLTKQIFGEQGIPERLISDNGPHYSSTLFKQFSREWGFEHYTSSPRYPQSNDLAECRVQAIKSAMQKATSSNGDLDMVLLCLRSTLINHVIPLPSELLHNRKLVGKLTSKVPQQYKPKRKNSNPPVSKTVIPKVSTWPAHPRPPKHTRKAMCLSIWSGFK